MICYRDMTFCKAWSSCVKGEDCERALTPEVQAGADDWWGKDGAPICMFTEKPECYEEANDE